MFCRNSNYGTATCIRVPNILHTQGDDETCLHLHVFFTVYFKQRSGLQREAYTDHFRDPSGDAGQHSYNRQGMGLNRDFTRGEANMHEALWTQNERDTDAFLVV